jgi:hypothetical protein
MRLLLTTLLCALGMAQASAQTSVSQQLLELDDDERNGAFTGMARPPPGEISLAGDSNGGADDEIAVLGCAVLLVWTHPVLWSYVGGSGGIG